MHESVAFVEVDSTVVGGQNVEVDGLGERRVRHNLNILEINGNMCYQYEKLIQGLPTDCNK